MLLLPQTQVQNEVTFLLIFKINFEPPVHLSITTVIKYLFPLQHTPLR